MRTGALPTHPLLRLVASSAIYAGAFGYLAGVFLIALDLLRYFPATRAIAIGRVTLDGASKTADYAGALLFYVLVGFCTPFLARAGLRLFEKIVRPALPRLGDGERALLALTCAVPFWIAPLLHVVTRKEVWPLLLPPVLGWGICFAWSRLKVIPWLGRLFARDMAGLHALVVSAGTAWLLFRYLVKGALIAHIPTLFLEVIFLAFFLVAFDAAGVFIARLARLTLGAEERRSFAIYAWSLLPLLALPVLGLTLVHERTAIVASVGMAVVTAAFLSRRDLSASGKTAYAVTALVVWPWLLFAWTYASTAALSSWIDLFHRGEALGPASDYLRGKVPFRDVFILHGLLENGFLDAWLMRAFGRSAEVSIFRTVVIGSLTLPAVYAIALTLFRRISPALLTVFLGMVTFADNQRIVFHLIVVLLLLVGLRRESRRWWFAAGLVSGVTIFYSLDIAIYAIVTVLLTPIVLRVLSRRPLQGPFVAGLAGIIAGAAPFALYLASVGVFGRFLTESFVLLPGLIEAVWSLPYPDLGRQFRSDLSLRGLTGFVLGEEIRFVLNPLVIVAALGVIVTRWRTRTADFATDALIVLTIGALIAQRSALGRADFRHQYFAAYLIAPLLMLLFAAMWRRIREARVDGGSKAFVMLLMPVAALALFIALWVPDLLTARLGATIQYRPRISGLGQENRDARIVRERIEAVSAAVRELAPGDAPIYDFSNQPAFYFFADRPNPTRFYQVPIAASARFQREVIEDLSRTPPLVVLRESPDGYDRFDAIENDARAPRIANFLDRHWTYARTVRGVEIWTPRSAEGGAPRQSGSKPPPDAVWSDERLVFPAVASARGAAESEWQSTLIAFNDRADPIPLGLRYLSTAGNRDIPVEVPAQGTLVLPDVVRTLFEMPGSTGTLVVKYPESLRPVLAVETLDTLRPSSLTVSSPLQSTDAADAEWPEATLVVVGARGGDHRRVNIGLVNVGEGDMVFNISLRRRDGSIAGTPIEGSVAEGDRYQLVNSERTFGAAIEAGWFIHVRIHRGRAIGFASVIDGMTGASQLIPARPSVYP